MITFFDTSSLLKLYFTEPGTEAAQALWDQSEMPCASVLLVPEMLATIARKRREGESAENVSRLTADFQSAWLSIVPVSLDEAVLRRCAEVLPKHVSRGADAVHLASALIAADAVAAPLRFACADRQLAQAARLEGLEVAVTL